jgi:hypothetical protein
MKNYLIIILSLLFLGRVYGALLERQDQLYTKFLDSHVRNLAREILDIYKNCKLITKDVHDAVDDTKCGTGLVYDQLISDMFNKPLYYKKVEKGIYVLGFADNNFLKKTTLSFSHKPFALVIDFNLEKIFVSHEGSDTLSW